MLILKIVTQHIDKIGQQTAKRTAALADGPNGTNYWVNQYFLPFRCFLPISATYLPSDGFAVECPFTSLTAAEEYGSKARLRRATDMTTNVRVGTPNPLYQNLRKEQAHRSGLTARSADLS